MISGAAAFVLLIDRSSIGIAASIGARSTPETRAGAAVAAVAALEEYLTALSESDAKAALEYVDATGQARKLLTDKVLKRSNELAPISEMTVSLETESGRSEYDVTVSVSFQAGEDTVKRTFDVYSYSEDSLYISDGLDHISDTYGYDGLGFQVNGVELEAESYPVFPGSYDFTLANPYFTFDTSKLNVNDPSDEPDEAPEAPEAPESDAETTAAALSVQTTKSDKAAKNAEAEGTLVKIYAKDDTEMLYTMSPKLTPEGEKTFRDLVRGSLNACIADSSLKTACGMDLSGEFQDGIIPTEGTAQRSLIAEGDALLNGLTPVLDYEKPAVVSTYDYLTVDTTIEGELDGQRGKAEVLFGEDPGSPSVDFGHEPRAHPAGRLTDRQDVHLAQILVDDPLGSHSSGQAPERSGPKFEYLVGLVAFREDGHGSAAAKHDEALVGFDIDRGARRHFPDAELEPGPGVDVGRAGTRRTGANLVGGELLKRQLKRERVDDGPGGQPHGGLSVCHVMSLSTAPLEAAELCCRAPFGLAVRLVAGLSRAVCWRVTDAPAVGKLVGLEHKERLGPNDPVLLRQAIVQELRVVRDVAANDLNHHVERPGREHNVARLGQLRELLTHEPGLAHLAFQPDEGEPVEPDPERVGDADDLQRP